MSKYSLVIKGLKVFSRLGIIGYDPHLAYSLKADLIFAIPAVEKFISRLLNERNSLKDKGNNKVEIFLPHNSVDMLLCYNFDEEPVQQLSNLDSWIIL